MAERAEELKLSQHVMAGLVPAIHVLIVHAK